MWPAIVGGWVKFECPIRSANLKYPTVIMKLEINDCIILLVSNIITQLKDWEFTCYRLNFIIALLPLTVLNGTSYLVYVGQIKCISGF